MGSIASPLAMASAYPRGGQHNTNISKLSPWCGRSWEDQGWDVCVVLCLLPGGSVGSFLLLLSATWPGGVRVRPCPTQAVGML